MIARIVQILCAFYMVVMCMAAAIHWWSLRDFTRIARNSPSRAGNIVASHKSSAPQAMAQTTAIKGQAAKADPKPATAPAPSPTPTAPYPANQSARDQFYASLLKQIENLQNQNRDLIDQLAETNRELMKLEFRTDTLSSQFRPLPVTEDRHEAYMDEDQGVLPPRPLVVEEPFAE